MSPRLKEFITAVLLDLAENCDWTISPTGQIEHSPFFEYAEKHLHIIETELNDMRESEQRFSKCFERIARAVGITSPLVLMSMAESDTENYAEILARHIENRESKKAKEVLGL